jgi:prephenate dehydratase
MRIAIQGELGSFSHEAALKFEPGAEIVPCSVSADAFRALTENRVDAIAIPIENSLAGSVVEHYDLLLREQVRVERETLLRIRHNLIAVSGTQISGINRVYSHPVALAQCRRFFAEHPAMEPVAFYDTAGSVKQLVELRDRHSAAVASIEAARQYNGQVLASGIEDNPENFTRFFLVRREADVTAAPEANKLSLAFSLANQAGALVQALNGLAKRGVNLTKIESRPVHGKPWEYIFYLDCQLAEGTTADEVLADLGPFCAMLKELGRYIGTAS